MVLENIRLTLSLLNKSEETSLFDGNAEFIDVNPDGKIYLTAVLQQSK
jgi:hypothetical protein